MDYDSNMLEMQCDSGKGYYILGPVSPDVKIANPTELKDLW